MSELQLPYSGFSRLEVPRPGVRYLVGHLNSDRHVRLAAVLLGIHVRELPLHRLRRLRVREHHDRHHLRPALVVDHDA